MASRVETLKELVAATADSGSKPDGDVEKLMFEAAINALLSSKASSDPLRYVEKTLSVKALTNLTDSEVRCQAVLENHEEAVKFCLSEVTRLSKLQGMDSNFWKVLIDFLSNVTRWDISIEKIVELSEDVFDLQAIVGRISSSCLQTLLPLILNLSQSSKIRRSLCQEPHFQLSSILHFLSQEKPPEVRKLAAGIIKNVCFEDDCHNQLVSSDCTNALPVILSCLVSHSDLTDGIDDEDLADLPAVVQSALKESVREREPDEEVRLRLVRAILQLCATPLGREALTDMNGYVVLRELYKWENEHGSRSVLLEAQHIIDVLITETEPNPEQVVPDYDKSANFRHLSISEEDKQLVERVDKEFLEKS